MKTCGGFQGRNRSWIELSTFKFAGFEDRENEIQDLKFKILIKFPLA